MMGDNDDMNHADDDIDFKVEQYITQKYIKHQ